MNNQDHTADAMRYAFTAPHREYESIKKRMISMKPPLYIRFLLYFKKLLTVRDLLPRTGFIEYKELFGKIYYIRHGVKLPKQRRLHSGCHQEIERVL